MARPKIPEYERAYRVLNKKNKRDFFRLVDREELIAEYAWAVPGVDALRAIRPFSPILEVGAGSGYWAWELRRFGVDVVATDIKDTSEFVRFKREWVSVVEMDAVTAVKAYPDRTLLMVWPTYDVSWAEQALASYCGSNFIYIGEGDGGCTADAAFHSRLERGWCFVNRISIPRWFGLNDSMLVFRRRLLPPP